MSRTITVAWGLLLALLCAEVAQSEDGLLAVKVGEITINVPRGWKQQPPSGRLRLAQFAVPAADGDEQPSELSIFAFRAGSTVAQNVQRWLGQFEPAGRKFKGTTGKSPHGVYVLVELSGTYKKPIGPPIQGRTVAMPGARVLHAMIAVEKKGTYFLKLVGHDKTVAANAKAFRTAIGASGDEQPLKLDES